MHVGSNPSWSELLKLVRLKNEWFETQERKNQFIENVDSEENLNLGFTLV